MKDKVDDLTLALVNLSNAIGTHGWGKAKELIDEGHPIEGLDIAMAFIYCAYRTLEKGPHNSQTACYVEIIKYLTMIAKNETEEIVFKFILDVLKGYVAGNESRSGNDLERLFPFNKNEIN